MELSHSSTPFCPSKFPQPTFCCHFASASFAVLILSWCIKRGVLPLLCKSLPCFDNGQALQWQCHVVFSGKECLVTVDFDDRTLTLVRTIRLLRRQPSLEHSFQPPSSLFYPFCVLFEPFRNIRPDFAITLTVLFCLFQPLGTSFLCGTDCAHSSCLANIWRVACLEKCASFWLYPSTSFMATPCASQAFELELICRLCLNETPGPATVWLSCLFTCQIAICPCEYIHFVASLEDYFFLVIFMIMVSLRVLQLTA